MASIYARELKLWCRLKADRGKWFGRLTPFSKCHGGDESKTCKSCANEERKAQRYADAAQEEINAQLMTGAAPTIDTLGSYALGTWNDQRREAGHDWQTDRARLLTHVLPVIGDLKLAQVRTVHVATLVRKLRFESKLAPRYVRNIYSALKALFRDAAVAGLVDSNPCTLDQAQLGNVVDKDPEWRAGALFTRDEAEILISEPRIPIDRQLVYAFGLLAGLRPGEAAALRWRHYDPSAQPLGRLLVATSYNTKRNITKRTKTETTKTIPVHPTLAAILAEWKLGGWEAMMSRLPEPDDLIVPLPPETIAKRTKRTGEPHRGYDYTGKRWRQVDLPMLGWRPRSVYDTKSTFITLAIEDGADDDIIRERITHTKQKRTAFDGYDRGPHWLATCRELTKLQINRRRDLATSVATTNEISNNPTILRGSGGGFRTLRRRANDSLSHAALQSSSWVSSILCPAISARIPLVLVWRDKILPRRTSRRMRSMMPL